MHEVLLTFTAFPIKLLSYLQWYPIYAAITVKPMYFFAAGFLLLIAVLQLLTSWEWIERTLNGIIVIALLFHGDVSQREGTMHIAGCVSSRHSYHFPSYGRLTFDCSKRDLREKCPMATHNGLHSLTHIHAHSLSPTLSQCTIHHFETEGPPPSPSPKMMSYRNIPRGGGVHRVDILCDDLGIFPETRMV